MITELCFASPGIVHVLVLDRRARAASPAGDPAIMFVAAHFLDCLFRTAVPALSLVSAAAPPEIAAEHLRKISAEVMHNAQTAVHKYQAIVLPVFA